MLCCKIKRKILRKGSNDEYDYLKLKLETYEYYICRTLKHNMGEGVEIVNNSAIYMRSSTNRMWKEAFASRLIVARQNWNNHHSVKAAVSMNFDLDGRALLNRYSQPRVRTTPTKLSTVADVKHHPRNFALRISLSR